MPYVVEEPPADMICPKFQWFGDHRGWYENSAKDQGVRLEKLEKKLTDTQEKIQNTQKGLEGLKTDTSKIDDATDKKVDNLVKLFTNSAVQLGQITGMVKSLYEAQQVDDNSAQHDNAETSTSKEDVTND